MHIKRFRKINLRKFFKIISNEKIIWKKWIIKEEDLDQDNRRIILEEETAALDQIAATIFKTTT